MSALGQKQTFAPQKVMSALPPKADIRSANTDVRFGPLADIGDRIEMHGSDLCISKHEPMTCRYFREHKVDG
jgi:hypothetical protein